MNTHTETLETLSARCSAIADQLETVDPDSDEAIRLEHDLDVAGDRFAALLIADR